MTDIKDNPSPLTDALIDEIALNVYGFISNAPQKRRKFARAIEAEAFSRGVAAGQASMQGGLERLQNLCYWNETIANNNKFVAEQANLQANELRAKLRALEEQPAIGRVQAHGDYYARVEWLLNPCEDGTLLYLAAGAKP